MRLVVVRCGSNGTQLARLFDRRSKYLDDRWVLLEKWRAKSGKWTNPRWFPVEVVIGDASPDDPRRKRALSER